MLEVREEAGRTFVSINYSSLELIQTCLRKAQYSLHENLESADSSKPALLFGTAVHKGLETWYLHEPSERTAMTPECMDFQTDWDIESKHVTHCARCHALVDFQDAGADLNALAMDDKRSLENGVDIMNAYFDNYSDDPFVVYEDADGPWVEKAFEYVIYQDKHLVITYHGTCDLCLVDTVNGSHFIVDHKTTWQLGTEFYNRLYPNFQYTGYVWLAQQSGLDVSRFLVNGLQVAKRARGFARQFTERSADDFAELRKAVVHNVKCYLEAVQEQDFPQNSPNPCSMYGGCEFRKLCEVPTGTVRDSVKQFSYKRKDEE